jgi:hypothetical protein
MKMMKRLAVAAAMVLGLAVAPPVIAATPAVTVYGEAVRYRTATPDIDSVDVLIKLTERSGPTLLLPAGDFWIQYAGCSTPSGYCKPVYSNGAQDVLFIAPGQEVLEAPPAAVAPNTSVYVQVDFVDFASRDFIMWYEIDGHIGSMRNVPLTKGETGSTVGVK